MIEGVQGGLIKGADNGGYRGAGIQTTTLQYYQWLCLLPGEVKRDTLYPHTSYICILNPYLWVHQLLLVSKRLSGICMV